MATLIPAVSRHEIARSIYRDIVTGNDGYYVFAGKSLPWGVVDTPDIPTDTRSYLSGVHKNMLFVKKVVPGPNDISYMIRRIDWAAGTVYISYSDDVDLSDEDFYVMTDEYNIYKCLDNNNGAQSTVKPSSTDGAISATQRLSDGYVWKFMYQVPVLDRIKFLTSAYIPVRNVSEGVNFDVNGVVNRVQINATGSGYIQPYAVIEGDGFTPSGDTTVVAIDPYGGISSVDIVGSYYGYTFARIKMYDVHVPPLSGTSYEGTIVVTPNDKTVTGIGTSFTTQLQVGWTLVTTNNENDVIVGIISSISSDTSLEVFEFPTITLNSANYTAFAGSGFEGTVILDPETANEINQDVVLSTVPGAIYKVDIDTPGTEYAQGDITVSIIGNGKDATFNATVDITGAITDVQITDNGQNYDYARLQLSSTTGTPGELIAHVGPQGGHGSNIAKELYAKSLCICTTLKTDNADLFVGNDFRQLGLIKNIKNYEEVYYNADTGTASYILTVTEDQYNNYTADDELQSSDGGIYKVVTKIEVDAQYFVYVLYIEGTEGFTKDINGFVTSVFTNLTTSASNLTFTDFVVPEFNKNTGTIIYVNNLSPISRTEEQAETVKLFLHF